MMKLKIPKKIAGIDYSLTSPAICVWETHDDTFNFYYLGKPSSTYNNLYSTPYPKWETKEQRHEMLSDWALSIIKGCEPYIEGYAYGATGNAILNIAENMGILKHKMYKIEQSFTTVPPTVIKKFATGKGNANKELMYDAFIAEESTPIDLKEQLTPRAEKIRNPVSDIVDSYFIAKYGLSLWN